MEVVDPFGMANRKCSLLKLFNPPLSSPSLAALGVAAVVAVDAAITEIDDLSDARNTKIGGRGRYSFI